MKNSLRFLLSVARITAQRVSRAHSCSCQESVHLTTWTGHCFQFPSLSASIAPGFCYLQSWNPFIRLYCAPAAAHALWKAEASGRKVDCPLLCNSILSPPALRLTTCQSCFRICVDSFSQQTLVCLRQLDILNRHKRFGTSWCLPPKMHV